MAGLILAGIASGSEPLPVPLRELSPNPRQPPPTRYTKDIGGRETDPHHHRFRTMFNSTRLALITGNPERLAAILISTPKVIGPRRARALFTLATNLDTDRQTRSTGRRALQQCAKIAGRHLVAHADGTRTQMDRVFSKASTLRLTHWAQGKNTPV